LFRNCAAAPAWSGFFILAPHVELPYYEDMNIVTSNSMEETQALAREWLLSMQKEHATLGRALVVGLSGHLGAGKTAFTKAVGRELGITEEITSPTFVIMKVYPTNHSHFKRLIHIDAYRMEEKAEMDVLKLDELESDPRSLIIIEWPENVGYESDLDEHIILEIRDGVYTFILN
jgi:tRNA threonylcarbamoyladenosine biosynthesis protein TsaE